MSHDFCSLPRREFLKTAGGVIIGAGLGSIARPTFAKPGATINTSESYVKLLYDSLTPKQRETICFPWDHVDTERGLLRTRVAANWQVTDEPISSEFYTADQQQLIRKVFEGIYNPDWVERVDRQLDDDSGGFGEYDTIAIFGEPGSDKFQFLLSGRHITVRCDGNTAEHVAFGGPIFYGHAAEDFNEAPNHAGNVYWHQALAANDLYKMLDGEQQQAALVRKGLPNELAVGFDSPKQGIPVGQLTADQQAHLQQVLAKLLEPYRQVDRAEVEQCLKSQGGVAACHLAYYQEGDIGSDQVWDNWRLAGPAFTWHYRGAPHVHVWVNVADAPSVELNAG